MYTNIRKKLNKFVDGGRLTPEELLLWMKEMSDYGAASGKGWSGTDINSWNDFKKTTAYTSAMGTQTHPIRLEEDSEEESKNIDWGKIDPAFSKENTDSTARIMDLRAADREAVEEQAMLNPMNSTTVQDHFKAEEKAERKETVARNLAGMAGINDKYIGEGKGLMSAAGAAAAGITSNVVTGVVNAADKAFMGDKNFGAQSEAIDSAVHGVSGALMKSGNPFAAIAGAALEGVNFLTKAGGQTVQGFDVDINNSGYGNLGHMESSSSRSFLGIGNGNVKDKLARRNEQARMALTAAAISEDSNFEQEARMNSVENTIMNNQIALSGGLDTSMLGG